MTGAPAAGWWDRRVVPRMVELSLRGQGVNELRQQTCKGLRGRVLELGFGSGLNVRYYPSSVDSVDAVEPSALGWELSKDRREQSRRPVRRVGLDGQSLDVADHAYDAVLSTFTLCTIPDPARTLLEVRRVLRAEGAFHFLEHGRAPNQGLRRWQRRMEPLQRRVAGGCHLTRDIPELIRDAGLAITDCRSDFLPGPGIARPWTFVYRGVAQVA